MPLPLRGPAASGAGYLPGLTLAAARRWHRRLGAEIVACVVLHVGGLYLNSPADVLDAPLLTSPTALSVYGVIAMWGVAATAVLVAPRRRAWLRARWSILHNALALVVVAAAVAHAPRIEGAMEIVSKWAIRVAALAATGVTLLDPRVVRPFARRRVAADRAAEPRPRGDGG